MELEVQVLGPLRVLVDGRAVELGPARRRALLAALAVDARRVVPMDTLADRMWSGEPAPQAAATIHAYVSRLRGALRSFDAEGQERPSPLRTQPPGYVLDVPPERVDAHVFADLVARARSTQDPVEARGLLGEALALWRGATAYLDVTAEFAVREADRLRELRLSALELSARLDLDLGRHGSLVDELGVLLEAEPLREGLHAALMLALYRSGRQAEALLHFDRVREQLAEELGIDPGPELRSLHERILRQDADLTVVHHAAETGADEVVQGTRIVGRDAELRRLLDAVGRGRTGTATPVVVVGEAGIGKSRLLEELAARASASGSLVAWGHCWQHEGAPVLWPWVQAVEALADQLDPAELAEALSGRGAGVAALVARLGTGAAQPASSLEGARVQLYDAVAGFLEAVTRRRHVLVLLEDLHWADRASRELVEYVATTVRQGQLSLVVSVRTRADESAIVGTELLSALARTGRTERVDLAGLDDVAVRDYVVDRTGSVLDDATAEALTDRTGGNPFFVGELVRLLVTDPGDDPVLPETVPDSIREVVLRRVQRLSEADQTVLTVAAVVGRTFDLGLLAAAAGLDDEAVDEAVDRATALDIVRSDAGGLDRHRFVHALTQQALLETTGPSRLRRLHAAVAAVLDAAEPKAYHLAASGSRPGTERAVELLTSVSDDAWRRGNLPEAEAVLLRALDLAFQLGPDGGRAEMSARVRLWSLYVATDGPGSPRELAQREPAMALVREHGDTRDLLAVHQSRLSYLLWQDGVEELEALVVEMDAAAEATGEDVMRLSAELSRAHLLALQGRFAASLAAWELTEELAPRVDVPVGVFAIEPSFQAPTWRAKQAIVLGDEAATLAHLDRLAARLEATDDVPAPTRSYVANTTSLVHAFRDDPARAVEAAAHSRELALAHGLTESLKHLDVIEAWGHARLGSGDPAEVVAAVARTESMATFAERPTLRSLCVDVLLRAGQVEAAAEQLDLAFANAETTRDVQFLAELHRQRALVLAAQGAPAADVHAALGAARAVAQEQGAGLFLRRTEATAAELG